MDHAGHDHSAHAASAPAMQAGKIAYPAHGTWPGHVLPGSFFVVWSTWWLISIFRLYLQSNAKAPFRSRAWFRAPWGGPTTPLEPMLKVAFTFVGINAELWAGHTSYRNLYAADGHFEMGNMQDWQHAAMYSAFCISGIVDLCVYYLPRGALPIGLEHVFLGLAQIVEGTLFAFHLKGSDLDRTLHFLLVVLVFCGAASTFGELLWPHNVLLSVARAQFVLLQGLWFWQIAEILFRERMAWDPDYHGSAMMAPVVFVMWLMIVAFGTFLAFLVTRAVTLRGCNCRATVPRVPDDEEGALLSNGRHSSIELQHQP